MKLTCKTLWLLMLVLLAAACGPASAGVTPSPVIPTAMSTNPPLPSLTPEPTTATPSFTAVTYRDETAGFEFDYPANWTLDPSSQVGVRGAQALLLSPGTTPETLAEGGSRVAVTVYLWDPKNDLTAYVAQRRTAWDASGFEVSSESTWTLADGREVKSFIVQVPDQPPAFFLFTTVGEDYLEISGEGDLVLVEEISRTLRPV
jgi:hypothetical protein